jgi:hypothetical protein
LKDRGCLCPYYIQSFGGISGYNNYYLRRLYQEFEEESRGFDDLCPLAKKRGLGYNKVASENLS